MFAAENKGNKVVRASFVCEVAGVWKQNQILPYDLRATSGEWQAEISADFCSLFLPDLSLGRYVDRYGDECPSP